MHLSKYLDRTNADYMRALLQDPMRWWIVTLQVLRLGVPGSGVLQGRFRVLLQFVIS